MRIVRHERRVLQSYPVVESAISDNDFTDRSLLILIAVFLTILGGIIATVVFGLRLSYQLLVIFPSLPPWMSYQIFNYFILDWFTFLGGILMFISAAIIYFEKWWPLGGVMALFGALVTVSIFSVVLGVIGGFVNLCSRPKPKRT